MCVSAVVRDAADVWFVVVCVFVVVLVCVCGCVAFGVLFCVVSCD